jgi:hypothetical protein
MIFLLKKHYASLEIDEFWTFVGSKANKQWLIYAYDREGKEIVAYVLGDRSAKTAKGTGLRNSALHTQRIIGMLSLPRLRKISRTRHR